MHGTAPRPNDLFDLFWQHYPRRVAKGEARKAWKKLCPSEDSVSRMIDAIAWQARQPGWTKERGQFIPYPASWIRAERWEDEPFEPELPTRGERWYEACERLGHEPRCADHLVHGLRVAREEQGTAR